MRLSGISRIIELALCDFIIHMELFIFYFLCELFFGIILFNSLCENKKPVLLILQTIIRKRDVIITEYQELSVSR